VKRWCWIFFLATRVWAGQSSGTVQSTRLYTPPDPAAHGGIHATLVAPKAPLQAVFAMPPQDTSKVYKGEVIAGGKEFLFRGLPVGKYDLMLVYEDSFYEGFTLTREPDSLTDRDRTGIKATVGRAVPFFDTKEIHRVAGTTGSEGKARCVLQELRTKLILNQNGDELKGYQIRSLKLAWLEDVGPTGWQLINTRELLRQEVAPGMRKGVLPHQYNSQLGNIRVTDETKDLGTLNLNQKESR
jgi:hypothetical protein